VCVCVCVYVCTPICVCHFTYRSKYSYVNIFYNIILQIKYIYILYITYFISTFNHQRKARTENTVMNKSLLLQMQSYKQS
jgi:hypothetical protein